MELKKIVGENTLIELNIKNIKGNKILDIDKRFAYIIKKVVLKLKCDSCGKNYDREIENNELGLKKEELYCCYCNNFGMIEYAFQLKLKDE